MNELALFAGAGGGLLGSHLLGWRTVCAVEHNAYAASVLMQRQNDGILPPFPIWDDIRTFDGKPWRGIAEIVSGGFPCQAFSTAARGQNNAENLWPEMRRVVADVAPKFVFGENVSAKAINTACDDLEQMGYSTRAVSLSAADMGADHIRQRYWFLAYADDKNELLRDFNAKMAVGTGFCSGVWQADTFKSGVDDGMADRVDRYKAIGNGQVPIVVVGAIQALCR